MLVLSTLPPKLDALRVPNCGAAQPAMTEAMARAVNAGAKRSDLDIILSLAVGLGSHGVELRHGSQQRVERVGHQHLCRAAANGAGKTEFEMASRIKAQRERRLALASRSRARARRTAHGRIRYADWTGSTGDWRLDHG